LGFKEFDMPVKHSREDVKKMMDKAAQDMGTFYRQEFVNYQGETIDLPSEPYSELIAKYLLNNLSLWEKIKSTTRPSSYNAGHEGIKPDDKPTNQKEKWLAKSMWAKTYHGSIGKVIDYEIPLNPTKQDGFGEIDLISVPDPSHLYLIELKKRDNVETFLRCALEIYTYFKIVDKTKLTHDLHNYL
jgi:hypothetical protein